MHIHTGVHLQWNTDMMHILQTFYGNNFITVPFFIVTRQHIELVWGIDIYGKNLLKNIFCPHWSGYRIYTPVTGCIFLNDINLIIDYWLLQGFLYCYTGRTCSNRSIYVMDTGWFPNIRKYKFQHVSYKGAVGNPQENFVKNCVGIYLQRVN